MQLREQKEAVEVLVDSVVDTYYSGFNKSLQNYSQILRLFSESRSQVRPAAAPPPPRRPDECSKEGPPMMRRRVRALQLESLRRSLETAQRQLSLRPAALRELYQRDLMLGDVARLLDDVAAVVEVPARVATLQANGVSGGVQNGAGGEDRCRMRGCPRRPACVCGCQARS